MRWLPLLLALQGCLVPDALVDAWLDRDGDGERTAAVGGPDCDDDDPAVNGQQYERCLDGIDNDCDGAIDEDGDGEATSHRDADGDGYGDPAVPHIGCAVPEGFAATGDDCDDGDGAVHPGAVERCGDGIDNDCDPTRVGDAPSPYRLDRDGDGYGGGDAVHLCDPPAAYVAAGGDCDDADPAVHPGAREACNGVDDDCDGAPELGAVTCHVDADGDGYGDPRAPVIACGPCPDGTVVDATDCADGDRAVHPGAAEVCDGVPNDCARSAEPRTAWFVDADGDGQGAGEPFVACAAPAGFVAAGGDCDDADPHVHAGAVEACNGRDDDCDGAGDGAAIACALDRDGDGVAGAAAVVCGACPAIPAGDCDDADPAVYPGAPEVCDGRPNDCAAAAEPTSTWHRDADGDGVGGGPAWTGCAAPAGFVAAGGDCDDADPRRTPGAAEVCDGVDNDCDGAAEVPAPCFADADDDGVGGEAVLACGACPEGAVAAGGDCDDADPTVRPGAPEVCDGVDGDCDGAAEVLIACFVDGDGDGQGATPVVACGACPEGAVAAGGDCDDADPRVWAGAPEVCDGVANACGGVEPRAAWFADQDGDGAGAGAPVEACAAPDGHVASGGDCDDADPAVHPGAPERCNGADDDCDGRGEGAPRSCFVDVDGDGYGAPAWEAWEVCGACPAGTVEVGGDCDDARADVHPGAAQVCGDGVDNACGGGDDVAPVWARDVDGDGHGGAVTVAACVAPPGYVAAADDCDDADPAVHPGAGEACDGVDGDCDGAADRVVGTCFADADGDGHGDPSAPALACGACPAGTVLAADDCADADPATWPGAPEVCGDGVVNDCASPATVEGVPTWHRDGDGDGVGGAAWAGCAAPPGFVAAGGDCDDADPAVHPGAVEVCDGVDSDCAGPDLVVGSCFVDADGDGFGDPGRVVPSCGACPAGTASAVDCDDADPATWPGAPEVCGDGVVNDCASPATVEGVPTWHRDGDGDGVGGAAWAGCAAPPGFVAAGGDCDDADPAVHPGAAEVCDGVDSDCAGPDAVVGSCFVDADGDGFGLAPVPTCGACPAGAVAAGGDCDDADAAVYPGAPEVCGDGAVNDCASPAIVEVTPWWYRDGDGDGVGDVAWAGCAAPAGYVATGGDCDDADPAVRPGAPEACDGRDGDCDGAAEAPPRACYADLDGDGHAGAAPVWVCGDGCGGLAAAGEDCDDADPAVHPGAPEVCGDGVNNGCTGATDVVPAWFRDDDRDGIGDDDRMVWSCGPVPGFSPVPGDCDDADPRRSRHRPEACDGVDNDCDGSPGPFEDAPLTCYTDLDADGYGRGASVTVCAAACAPLALVDGDCDDAAWTIHPGAPEICGDGVANDCSGGGDALAAWYRDQDGDGAGAASPITWACGAPAGFVAAPGDCDDADPRRRPGAPEVCDGVDNDCVGGAEPGTTACYADGDADGYGGAWLGLVCGPCGAGAVAVGGDCDDAAASRSPGVLEVCDNGVDEDCDPVSVCRPTGVREGAPEAALDGVALAGGARRPELHTWGGGPVVAFEAADAGGLDGAVLARWSGPAASLEVAAAVPAGLGAWWCDVDPWPGVELTVARADEVVAYAAWEGVVDLGAPIRRWTWTAPEVVTAGVGCLDDPAGTRLVTQVRAVADPAQAALVATRWEPAMGPGPTHVDADRPRVELAPGTAAELLGQPSFGAAHAPSAALWVPALPSGSFVLLSSAGGLAGLTVPGAPWASPTTTAWSSSVAPSAVVGSTVRDLVTGLTRAAPAGPSPAAASGAAVGDLDADGALDLARCGQVGGRFAVQVDYAVGGDGGTPYVRLAPAGADACAVMLADVGGDGVDDLVVVWSASGGPWVAVERVDGAGD